MLGFQNEIRRKKKWEQRKWKISLRSDGVKNCWAKYV